MDDEFLSVSGSAKAELKVLGSRFLATVFEVGDVQTAMDELDEIRRCYSDASHHCFAYRVGVAGQHFRFNDDREPSGTAGVPILQQIDARQLTNTLIVVTRYFGGTRLGKGGLARAYAGVAGSALDAATVVKSTIYEYYAVRFAYDDTSKAIRTIQGLDGEILASKYGEDTWLTIAVRRSRSRRFAKAFVDNLSGRGLIEKLND